MMLQNVTGLNLIGNRYGASDPVQTLDLMEDGKPNDVRRIQLVILPLDAATRLIDDEISWEDAEWR